MVATWRIRKAQLHFQRMPVKSHTAIRTWPAPMSRVTDREWLSPRILATISRWRWRPLVAPEKGVQAQGRSLGGGDGPFGVDAGRWHRLPACDLWQSQPGWLCHFEDAGERQPGFPHGAGARCHGRHPFRLHPGPPPRRTRFFRSRNQLFIVLRSPSAAVRYFSSRCVPRWIWARMPRTEKSSVGRRV